MLIKNKNAKNNTIVSNMHYKNISKLEMEILILI